MILNNILYFLQDVGVPSGTWDKILDGPLSLILLVVAVVAIWKYFQKQLEKTEAVITAKDAQISTLYEEKQKLAVDVIQTLGSFELILKATSPEIVKAVIDAIVDRLEKMQEDLKQAIQARKNE